MTDKPTDAMIEAGRAEAFNQAHRTYGDMCAAIYTAMHEARPQSAAPSPDARLRAWQFFDALEGPLSEAFSALSDDDKSEAIDQLEQYLTPASPDADLVERVARAIEREFYACVDEGPPQGVGFERVATAAIEALTATAPPSDSECPTCQGRGEMWAFVQGLGRAPGPVQCDDCRGTGRNAPSDSDAQREHLLNAIVEDGRLLLDLKEWLQQCHDWLLETDLDMQCPMEADPLDLIARIDKSFGLVRLSDSDAKGGGA